MRKILFILLSIFTCCSQSNRVRSLLTSKDPTDKIKGASYITDTKDSIFIHQLFNNINDPRVSHDFRYKGISVYEATIKALGRISDKKPPKLINYKIDTMNINFYKKWAKENGYVKDIDMTE